MRPSPGRPGEHGGMRPFGDLIAFGDALGHCLAAALPVESTEEVPLREALGRVAARDVASPVDVPPVDRCAMDGYALRASDTRGATEGSPITLQCTEVLHAATVARGRVGPGTCMQVATGSSLPPGADAVVMVERTRRRGEHVEVMVSVEPGKNIAPRGQDLGRGDRVVAMGTILGPHHLGAVAGVGLPTVGVYRRPRVTILTTGDEVVAPGKPLRPGQVYDINSYAMAGLVEASGGMALVVPRIPDDLAALGASLDSTEADLLVFTAGSSVGTRDLVTDLVATRGRIIFHGVAIRPGKPQLLGRLGDVPVLGMPGFPTSCLSNGYVFLRPMVRRMAHLPEAMGGRVRATLAQDVPSAPGRTDVVPVRLEGTKAYPTYRESSSITSLARAHGYFLVPAEAEAAPAGDGVEVILY